MDTLNYTQQYLHQYSYLGVVLLMLFFSFVLPLSKTLVIVGTGVLAAQGFGNAYLYFLFALLSLLFADSVYYLLGRVLGVKVLQWSMFKKRSRYLVQTNKHFERHAGLTIIASRYLPYVRVLIYIIAGINRMPYLFFLIADGITTFAYTLVFIYLGYSLAQNRQLLVEYVDETEFVIATTVIIILILVVYRRHRRRNVTSREAGE